MFENDQSLDPFGIATGFAPGDELEVEASEAEKQALTQLTQLRDRGLDHLRERHWSAQFNRLWLRGAQHIFYDKVRTNVVRAVGRQDQKDLPSIDNKLRPSHRAMVGKMFAELGHLEAVPRTQDRSDVQAAQTIDSYIEHFANQTKAALKGIRALGAISTDGSSWIELEWDHFQGPLKAACEKCDYVGEEEEIGQDCPLCLQEEILRFAEEKKKEQAVDDMAVAAGVIAEENPNAQFEGESIPKLQQTQFGQPTLRVHKLEDVIVDPGASETEDLQWVLLARPLPVNVVRKRYPTMWKQISPTPHLIRDRYLDTSLNVPELVERKLENHTVVYKYFEAASGMFPAGRIIHFTENKILEIRDNYYYELFNRMPFFLIRGDRNDAELYGQPWIDDAWHVQKERNKLVSQMRVHREITNYPRLVVESGSGINAQTVKAHQQLLTIEPRTRHVPYYLPAPQMPGYVQTEPDRLAEAIREKAGVTPHELGQTKSGESGRYSALLEAQSTESLSAIMFENREEWKEMHKCAVVLAQNLMDPDEMWSVTGSGLIKSHTWRQANVLPGYDIRVIHSAGYSRNPVVRRQQAMEDLQAGLFLDKRTGTNDMKKYAKAAGIHSTMYAASSDDADRYYARELIEIIKSGQMPVPQLWDNAEVIYGELTHWLRTEGRNEPAELQAMVGQLWMHYLQGVMSSQTPPDPDFIANMPYMELGAGAFQGQTTQPAGMGAGGNVPQNGPTGQQTADNVQMGDQAGEAAARPQQGQETGPKNQM